MFLNIIRTLKPSLTPIPNATGFGTAGSMFAQLWYGNVEQFYCQANSCTQDLITSGPGSANWNCQNLQCTCISGTTACGVVNLNPTINGLTGSITVACSTNKLTNAVTCEFQQSVLDSLFGSTGLSLNPCTFGECVQQSVIDDTSSNSSRSAGGGGKELSGGVIAGLVVVVALLLQLTAPNIHGSALSHSRISSRPCSPSSKPCFLPPACAFLGLSPRRSVNA
jgi:hypothetical protein